MSPPLRTRPRSPSRTRGRARGRGRAGSASFSVQNDLDDILPYPSIGSGGSCFRNVFFWRELCCSLFSFLSFSNVVYSLPCYTHMISRRPAQMWAICVVLWPLMCVPSSPGAPTTARGGSVDFGGREAGPQWLLATPVAAPDRRVARTPCGALDRLIVLRGGVASASAARALARGDHHMPDGGDTVRRAWCVCVRARVSRALC